MCIICQITHFKTHQRAEIIKQPTNPKVTKRKLLSMGERTEAFACQGQMLDSYKLARKIKLIFSKNF